MSTETTIRRAKYSELWTCANVLADSFRDDVLFGAHIHPHRAQFPHDMALFFYREMQSEFWDWSMVFVVAVEPPPPGERGADVITGLAMWHRLGERVGRTAWSLAWWDPRRVLEPVTKRIAAVQALINPNRAASLENATILGRSEPFTKHFFTGQRTERWYLHFLGVRPEYQNKGIGRRLVAWGIERAKLEGVNAGVVSAYGKDKFYNNCGFEKVIGWIGEGEGNPLGVIPGGNVWWVDAKTLANEEDKEGTIEKKEVDKEGK